jgi:hypothetical protein
LGLKLLTLEVVARHWGRAISFVNAAYVCEVVGAAGTNVNASLLVMVSKHKLSTFKSGTLVRFFITTFAHDAKVQTRLGPQSDKGVDNG